jgi:hypothetical protein
MALGGQFDKVIKKLTELTRADKVVWQETAAKDTFLAIVGKSVVTVGQEGVTDPLAPADAPCFVRIHDSGQAEAEVSVIKADYDNWIRIKTLVDFARHSATTKANKIVSDLLSTLEAIR